MIITKNIFNFQVYDVETISLTEVFHYSIKTGRKIYF